MSLYGALRALNRKTGLPAGSGQGTYGIGVWFTTVTLDGANPTPVTTPFRKVLGATANVNGAAAQAVGAAGVRRVETTWTGNIVNITAWGHVLVDATEIASTNSTAVIAVMVIGEY